MDDAPVLNSSNAKKVVKRVILRGGKKCYRNHTYLFEVVTKKIADILLDRYKEFACVRCGFNMRFDKRILLWHGHFVGFLKSRNGTRFTANSSQSQNDMGASSPPIKEIE